MSKFIVLIAGVFGAAFWAITAQLQRRGADIKRLKQDKLLAQQNIAQKQREEKAVSELKQDHREEQVNVQKRINEGDRSQLDNDW
jgi:hypothetical protein